MQSKALDKARIEIGIKKVRHTFAHVSDPADFDNWLDSPAPAWGGLTARQMVIEGRTDEVVSSLEAILDGIYL